MSEGQQGMSASPFEIIRQVSEEGFEYWSARDLSKILGYVRWENFQAVIPKAEMACIKSGYDSADHFREATKVVTLGSGVQRNLKDFHLSRYACYLIVQNADPEKEIVALGQT